MIPQSANEYIEAARLSELLGGSDLVKDDPLDTFLLEMFDNFSSSLFANQWVQQLVTETATKFIDIEFSRSDVRGVGRMSAVIPRLSHTAPGLTDSKILDTAIDDLYRSIGCVYVCHSYALIDMAGMSNHLLKPIVPEQMDSSTLFDDAAWAIHGSSKTVLQFSQGGVIFSDVLQVGISSPFEHAVEQAQKMRIRKIFKGLGTSLAKSRAIASWTYASSWGAACAEAIYKYSTGNRPGT